MTARLAKPLRVVFVHWPPYQSAERKNGVLSIGGAGGKTLDALASSLNFTYTVKQMGSYGLPSPNGSWTGMIGALQEGEADAAITGTICNYERFPVVHCGPIIGNLDYGILSASSPARFDAFSYVKAFDVEVWIIVFTSLVLLAFLVALAGWLHKHSRCKSCNDLIEETSKHCWDLFGLLFAESAPRVFPRGAQKVLIGAWLITILVLSNSFASLLKSQQAVFSFKPEVDSVEDLADKHHMTPFILAGTTFEYLPQKIRSVAVKTVWDRSRRRQSFLLPRDIYQDARLFAVAEGHAAIIVDDLSARARLTSFCERHNRRNFVLASQPVHRDPFCHMFSKHLDEQFYKLLRSKFRRLLEAGLIQKWFEDAQGNWQRCVQTGDIAVKDLGLDDVMPFFLLWGIMCVMACCAFIGELGWTRLIHGRRSLVRPLLARRAPTRSY